MKKHFISPGLWGQRTGRNRVYPACTRVPAEPWFCQLSNWAEIRRREKRAPYRVESLPTKVHRSPAIAVADLKKDWVSSPEAFRRLLEWLNGGSDPDGERYLEVRRRLVTYFDRKGCLLSDELADETLNRIARKLEEKGEITEVSPLHYCYIVGKFVFLETIRRNKAVQDGTLELTMSDPLGTAHTWDIHVREVEDKEKVFDCLERCLDKLPQGDRELILEYYRGEQRAKIERRSEMAARLGVTMNALTIRACRIRTKLETCVKACSREA